MKKTKHEKKAQELMNRRLFLEYSLKLTALAASAPLLKINSSEAQSTSINAPVRFVNFFIRSGSCQLGNYLCPTANINDLSTLDATKWKVPGLATSFRPSSPANAAKENVDYFYPKSGESTSALYGTQALGSQPIYHARTTVGSYQMPLLWSSLIPTGVSGTIQMKDLIQTNCAMVYGLESSPAHPVAENMLLDPEPGSFTIGGYISSSSTKSFFSALGNDRSVKPYQSPSGSGMRIFSGNSSNGGPAKDSLNSLLPNSLESGNDTRRAWLTSISDKMKTALDSMRISNMGIMPGITELYKLLNEAKTAVDQETYTSVTADFETTLTKYKNLLNRAVSMAPTSIQGITDPDTNATFTRSTLRIYDGTNPTKANPKLAFTNCAAVEEMAYIFAFAEVALRNNLTHVLQLGFSSMVKLAFAEGVSGTYYNPFDNHNIGVVANLMSGGMFYYVFNTLMYEFKQNIKGNSGGSLPAEYRHKVNDASPGTTTATLNPWRDTVILINTEFPRNPRRDGSGSDHGYEAANVTMLSGRLPANLKIYGKSTYGSGSSDIDHTGAWGRKSNLMYKTDRYVSTKDIGASLAGLFVRTTPHPGLQTLLDRSKICFSLDSNGNIIFNSSVLTDYSLENT